MFDHAQTIYANFDLSWADVRLSIDDELVDSWSNDNRTIPLNLSSGTHSIKIEFTNHWHTVGFNASFQQRGRYSSDQATPIITPLISEDTLILFAGAYESSDLQNRLTIELGELQKPVFIFISSYHALNLSIENPFDIPIVGVAYASLNSESSLYTDENTMANSEIFALENLSYDFENFDDVSRQIRFITGRKPDLMNGAYSTERIIFAPIDPID